MTSPITIHFNVKKNEYDEYICTPTFIHHNASNFNQIPCKSGKGVAFGYRDSKWPDHYFYLTTGILFKNDQGIINQIEFDGSHFRKIELNSTSYVLYDLYKEK